MIMARMSDIKVTFEIEPVVKLVCLNKKCRYNMTRREFGGAFGFFCNLKNLEVDQDGKCAMFERGEE